MNNKKKPPRDLLYDDNSELRAKILSQWPNAKLNRIRNDIFGARLEINVDCKKEDWLRWLIKNKLAGLSFIVKCYMISENKKDYDLLLDIMDTEKPGWR